MNYTLPNLEGIKVDFTFLKLFMVTLAMFSLKKVFDTKVSTWG